MKFKSSVAIFALERTGGTVFLTPGDYRNIKITTPEDLLVAEAFAAAQDNAPG